MKKELEQFGLTKKEISAYLALLELGEAGIGKIALRANVKRTSIYNFMDRLISMGLVSRSVRKNRATFRANDPKNLLAIQEQRTLSLTSILPKLLALHSSEKSSVSIDYLDGTREIRRILDEELASKKEVLYIWPAKDIVESLGGLKHVARLDKERIRKGITVRSIHFHNKLVKFDTWSSGKEFLRETRLAPKGFDTTMGMAIYDTQKVAFFSSKRDAFGLIVSSQEFWRLMKGVFEIVWNQAEEV